MARYTTSLVKIDNQWQDVTMEDIKYLFGNAVFPPSLINPPDSAAPGAVGKITSASQINDNYVLSYHDLRLVLELITSGYTSYGNYAYSENYNAHCQLPYMFTRFDNASAHGDSATVTILNDKVTWDTIRTSCTQSAFTSNYGLGYAVRMWMPKVRVTINIGLGSWSSRMSYYGYNTGTTAYFKVYGFGNNIAKSTNSYSQNINKSNLSYSMAEKKGNLAYGNTYYNAGFVCTMEYPAVDVSLGNIPQKPWRWANNTFYPAAIGAFGVGGGWNNSGDYYYGSSWPYSYIQIHGNGEKFGLYCTSVNGYVKRIEDNASYTFTAGDLILPTFVSGDTLNITVNYTMTCRLHAGSDPSDPGGGTGGSSLLGLTGILGMPASANISKLVSELSSNDMLIVEDDE